MKIAFVSSEGAPFSKSGGLGDVASALPKALAKEGHEVVVFLPLYGQTKNRFEKDLYYLTNFKTDLSWRRQYTGLFRYTGSHNPTYIFIDNEYYFSRDTASIYGHYDDGERFAYFSKAVCDALGAVNFMPDVIHCNDWQTAALPVFLRCFYPQYNGSRTVFTIHNIEYQGQMPPDFAVDVMGLSGGEINDISYNGCVNLMKGAIVRSDAVTTVSKTYAEEIQTPYYGHQLDPILVNCRGKLSGIVNGIDTDVYNPQTDGTLSFPYSADKFAGKKKNKEALQTRLHLNREDDKPLVVMISRFAKHKGFDLVARVIDEMMQCGIQLAVLGTGEPAYENMFSNTAMKYPGRMSAMITFDAALANQMYSAADIFLMPSLSEPCGLSQLVAMRYGAVPIVRETGGLKDTVPAYNPMDATGRGFTFVDYNAHEMLRAVQRCSSFYYQDRMAFEALQKRNMTGDYSWCHAVREYEALYNRITGHEYPKQ